MAVIALVAVAVSQRSRDVVLPGVGAGVAALDAVKVMQSAEPRAPVVAGIATRRRVLAADGQGLRIPMSDDPPARIPAAGVPVGWELREFAGQADVELVRGERGLAVHLRSERASFALYRDLVVGLDEFPILSWSWKVARLPTGGDVRRADRDDQAAQIYVIFPRWPSPRTQSDVIGYVWDTTAPKGSTLASPKATNVKIVVVQSGPERLGNWERERRNVARDYQALFGRRPPRVGTIAIMIDTNETGSVAEATVGDLMFARATPKE